jgi:hypothetical protein
VNFLLTLKIGEFMIPTNSCADSNQLLNNVVQIMNLPRTVFRAPDTSTKLKEFICNNKELFCSLRRCAQLGIELKALSLRVSTELAPSLGTSYLVGAFQALAQEAVMHPDYRLLPDENTPFKKFNREFNQ